MTDELRNKIWETLPKEYRDEVKAIYTSHTARQSITSQDTLLDKLFGKLNLTSDEEPSELLFVERNKVVDLYATMDKAFPRDVAYSVQEALKSLFGDKCMPDTKGVDLDKLNKKLDEALEKETSESLNEWIDTKEGTSVQGEPKFKVGDKVKVIDTEEYADEITEIIAVDKSDPIAPYKLDLLDDEGCGIWCDGDAIEPYTKPETKNVENNIIGIGDYVYLKYPQNEIEANNAYRISKIKYFGYKLDKYGRRWYDKSELTPMKK